MLNRRHARSSIAAKNAASFSGSLTPGEASTPEATSTPHGRAGAIPSATFSAVSPPESRNGTFARRCASSAQSHVCPLPP